MRRLALTVTRVSSSHHQESSFGFTVTHACPCLVGKVEPGGAAFRAGLVAGDFIASVNGTNVSRATCATVVKLIKASGMTLRVEVCREQPSSLTEASLCQGSGQVDDIAGRLLHSHLEHQQRMLYQDMLLIDGADAPLCLEAVEYRRAETQSPHLHQQQQTKPTANYVNQFGLEVVMEEEEEENDEEQSVILEINGEEEEENDYQELDKESEFTGYIHAEHKFRHVDSSSDANSASEADDLGNAYYERKEAELLRKAAQQFYSHGEAVKRANVLSLRNLRRDDEPRHLNNFF